MITNLFFINKFIFFCPTEIECCCWFLSNVHSSRPIRWHVFCRLANDKFTSSLPLNTCKILHTKYSKKHSTSELSFDLHNYDYYEKVRNTYPYDLAFLEFCSFQKILFRDHHCFLIKHDYSLVTVELHKFLSSFSSFTISINTQSPKFALCII